MTHTQTAQPRSHVVTQGLHASASRGMLRGLGFSDADLRRSQIGIGSSWNEITPCNLSLRRLAEQAAHGVREASGVPMEFGTISVSDGISMGHEGMHFSLVSRDLIADSVETVMEAERLDGSVLLAGCDKSLPGMMMGAARLGLASVFVYAGTSMPGVATLSDGSNREVTIIDAFEAVGACVMGRLPRQDVDAIERTYCPGAGGCAGMYTANTMASMAEALGLALPGSASPPAVDSRRDVIARDSGAAVVRMIESGMTTRDILTRSAFRNAIAVLMALGGSTNAVLHLLAIAREAQVPLSLDDFDELSRAVPHLSNVKPFGEHVMRDVDLVGGIPVVMRALLDAGYLDGDALTVSGQSLTDNLTKLNPPAPDGLVLRDTANPIRTTGGLSVIRGSLCPDGAIAKTAGFTYDHFRGRARVFDGERAALDALDEGSIEAGNVVVIRNEGPRGGPGMREMLAITGAIKGAGLGDQTLLITDGRFSGGSTGNCIAHLAPESVSGGPIGVVQDGDEIEYDEQQRTLDLVISEDELRARLDNFSPVLRERIGVLGKYQRLVGSASDGARCL